MSKFLKSPQALCFYRKRYFRRSLFVLFLVMIPGLVCAEETTGDERHVARLIDCGVLFSMSPNAVPESQNLGAFFLFQAVMQVGETRVVELVATRRKDLLTEIREKYGDLDKGVAAQKIGDDLLPRINACVELAKNDS